MDITYLIGNGFDISVGLHTKYSEFLEYYRAIKSDIPLIQKFKDSITENQELWSDAEIGFGEYTKEFSDLEEFEVCHRDFCLELCDYLRAQEKMLIQPNDNIKKSFCDALVSYPTHLRPAETIEINRILNSHIAESFKYNFINFNYTRAFDRCYQYARKTGAQFAYHDHAGSKHAELLSNLIHVHGDLSRPVLMGVNDESQVANKELLKTRQFVREFIKPETNNGLKNLVNEKVQEIIEGSNILIIFGMSLGKTDKKWWKNIARWLNNTSGHLIIYTRCADFNINLGGVELAHEEKIQNLFLSYSGYNEQIKDALINRIHIVTNKSLFDFTMVNDDKIEIEKSA